uniref:Olfactory receptor n=1 Tax=Podarcis muralis TaxID=64176 RepID=A0A670HUC5_PODMU
TVFFPAEFSFRMIFLITSIKHDLKGMEKGNYTLVSEFILLGFTDHPELQILLFVVFLTIYVVTLMGNFGIILIIRLEVRLHTPMYFFLSHLSFIDICYSSSITPKLLVDIISEAKGISFSACAVQMYLFVNLVVAESYLLAVMAYDRYVAICNPLLYTVAMSRKLCKQLTIFTFRLTFCGSHVINHFYCADPPLMKLSCSDTHVKQTLMLLSASFNLISSLVVILISYIFILSTILRIPSVEGRYKAFSTCGFHLMAVTLFYGTVFVMYIRRPSSLSPERGKIVSLFYAVVIPMLNPLIYSLRNKEVKGAMKRLVGKQKWTLQMKWDCY